MGPTGIQSTLPLGPLGQPRGPDHTAVPGHLVGTRHVGVCPRCRLRRWGPSHACRWADRRRTADLQIHRWAERPGGGARRGGAGQGACTRALEGLDTACRVRSAPGSPPVKRGLSWPTSQVGHCSQPHWGSQQPSPHLRRARHTRAPRAARVQVWAGPPGCGVQQVSRGQQH